MRILVINFEYPPLGGGGGIATQHICEALAHRHDVSVITTHFPSLPTRENLEGVKIFRVPVWGRKERETASLLSLISFVWPALRCAWQLCRAEKFDVVNAQFVVPSGIPAAIVAWWFTIPLVVSFIGGDVYDPSKGTSPHRIPVLRWLIRRIAARAAARTAISYDTKERATSLHGVRQPISVIPLGFVPHPVPATTREALGLPANTFLFVSIGRLIPRKGFAELLAAWEKIPQAHLAIVGAGPLDESLRTQARLLGIEGRVHFMGYVSETQKHQILRAADAYISAARHEGFGLVFLEAMAAGLPIVATSDGGQVDFLKEGRNALLVPPDDQSALLAGATRVMRDAALQAQLKHYNLTDVANFTISKTTAQFEMVLQQATTI